VALVQDARFYVGPALCRELAASGHDLVVRAPRRGLVAELEALGASVEVVEASSDSEHSLLAVGGWADLVDQCMARFGRLDTASISPPCGGTSAFVRGPFMDTTVADVHAMSGYLDSTLLALRALIGAMADTAGGGQIVVFTSDAGARPEEGWSVYGAIRAGQNFLVQAVALEYASTGICINAIGSKNAVFAGFPGAPAGAVSDDAIELGDWSATQLSETPLPRLGTMEELAAFAAVLLDGRSRFQTAQVFSYSGGWNVR
jgi:NAD(P)-dependent dehydrogenase (short-subunit alcohol dehydrogenase family)